MSNNVNASPTQVTTGIVRLSYANLNEAKSINGGEARFSANVLIPKSDTKTLERIKAAIQAAYTEGEGKLRGTGKTVPPMATLKLPLRDGDAERPDDEAYAGHYFLNANNKERPDIVDINLNPIINSSELYSGIYARVFLGFYAFNSSGNRGIAVALNGVQKVKDGPSLGGRVKAADVFSDGFTFDDDDLDFLS